MLLLQTSKVMYEPRCLAKLYAVCRDRVPIVPVVLMKSKSEHDAPMYDFATAKPMMEDLAGVLDAGTAAIVTDTTGTPVDAVGLALSLLLPNIISKPLGIGVAAGEIDAQMAEIERTLRRSITSTGDAQVPQTVRPQATQKGDLSAAQVAQLRAAFERVDSNSDGGITPDEIMSAIRKDVELGELLGLSGETDDDQVFDAGRLFQSMDTDGDQSIDVDEFVAFFGQALSSEHDVNRVPKGDVEDGARP